MLAFLALWLKLAIPMGFMPVQSDGVPAFAICSAGALPGEGRDGLPADAPSKAGMDCVFSLLHASALAADDPAPDLKPLGRIALPDSPSFGAAPAAKLFAPPPPSHAPPAIIV
jgi:hypothetical protein